MASLSIRKEWVEATAKLVIPLVLFGLGWLLVDRVENVVKMRRLEVDSADAIKELLNTLHSEIGQAEANSAALTLAAYGEAAIIPLVGTLEYGPPQSVAAARRALFMIGLEHPKSVTKTLAEVLARRHGQFHAYVHQIAIAVLGEIEHADAKKPLLEYRSVVALPAEAGLPAWSQMVRGAKTESYKATQTALTRALAALGVSWTPAR